MNPVLTGLLLFLTVAPVDDVAAGRPLDAIFARRRPRRAGTLRTGTGRPRSRGDRVPPAIPDLHEVPCRRRRPGRSDRPRPVEAGHETTDAYLIESVLQPSKIIKKGFETVTIGTADGKIVTGLLAEDRADRWFSGTPRKTGKLVTILKRDIDSGPTAVRRSCRPDW